MKLKIRVGQHMNMYFVGFFFHREWLLFVSCPTQIREI
jgi:hypothetical protein